MGDSLKRMMIESLAERAIRRVQEDPKRSVRKLVDMGQQFATGRFQTEFFKLSEHLLSDEESPYYRLILSMVQNADPIRLKTFGVNLGWQSCTVGANQIRAIEAEEEVQIPWCSVFHLGRSDGPLTPEMLERLLIEGEELGIYTSLVDGEGADGLSRYLSVLCRQKSMAFLLLLTPEQVRKYENQLAAGPNLMVLVSADQAGWEIAGDLLSRRKMLFGFFERYSGTPPKMEQAFLSRLTDHGGMTLFLLAEPPASPELVEQVREKVLAFRHCPDAPLFLVDFYSDHGFVDEVISGHAGFLGVARDGTLLRCERGREVPDGGSLNSRSLRELLK